MHALLQKRYVEVFSPAQKRVHRVVFNDLGTRGFAESLCNFTALEEPADRARESGGVFRGNEDTVFVIGHDFGIAPDVGRDDGNAVRHRLEQSVRKTLAE